MNIYYDFFKVLILQFNQHELKNLQVNFLYHLG